MKLVLVPAGEFLMGGDESPDNLARDYPAYERKRLVELSDEAPVHAVRITRPFFLGQHEVTVGQFRRFLEASGYTPESEADGTGGYGYNASYDPSTTARGDAFQGRDSRYSWRDPGFPQGDDHPVLNVTWNDAVAMSQWLSRQEGRRYRLPTEAEWEYACRAGTRTRYYSGDDPRSLLKVANTFDAEAARNWPRWQAYALEGSDGFAFTAPVGSFEPNALGCTTCSAMPGSGWSTGTTRTTMPRRRSLIRRGPEDGTVRVRRGGSWHTWALYARCGYRNWNSARTRYTLLGMRLLREVDDTDPVSGQRALSLDGVSMPRRVTQPALQAAGRRRRCRMPSRGSRLTLAR